MTSFTAEATFVTVGGDYGVGTCAPGRAASPRPASGGEVAVPLA
ncbi:hypothetical protein [Streptomyces sp. NBC_00140]|nr:hypothetical protein [Streptomyces sp. NBC_00140]MCX5334266.1 hypothetical protein [Streptomyces sp. NBC_00140]